MLWQLYVYHNDFRTHIKKLSLNHLNHFRPLLCRYSSTHKPVLWSSAIQIKIAWYSISSLSQKLFRLSHRQKSTQLHSYWACYTSCLLWAVQLNSCLILSHNYQLQAYLYYLSTGMVLKVVFAFFHYFDLQIDNLNLMWNLQSYWKSHRQLVWLCDKISPCFRLFNNPLSHLFEMLCYCFFVSCLVYQTSFLDQDLCYRSWYYS